MRLPFFLAVLALAAPAAAQSPMGSYQAFVGQADLVNSRGERLTEAWQVLRQDRANVHRFGIRQPGDEIDPYFGSLDGRAAMERMLQGGAIPGPVAGAIMGGGVAVRVDLYGQGGAVTALAVSLAGGGGSGGGGVGTGPAPALPALPALPGQAPQAGGADGSPQPIGVGPPPAQ